ncbi:MAG TPA: BNR-4 repeat-containing protein [Chitinivibrionales bacterium]|nr:BNR-4 repeat-containing protein [Chitinivibrionales bacterium]
MSLFKVVGLYAGALTLLAFVSPSHAQAIPKPGEQFAAMSNDAMWTWYGEPKAVYFEGTHRRTYMAWNKSTGDKQVGYYDHDTKETLSVIMPHMPYGGDDHDHPSIIMRPDGRLILFCTGHDGNEVTEYIMKNPEDLTSGWNGPYYPGGNGGYCYPNAVFLKNEGTQGRFYIFYRDNTQYAGETDNYCPAFCTSDDWGVTWSAKKRLYLYVGSAYKPYLKYATDGLSEIYISIEYQNREGDGKGRPDYFVKYSNGTFYADDNHVLATMATLPILNTQLDTVFYAYAYGAGFSGTACDIAIDANNNPVILYCSFLDTSVYEYWYVRWTGTSWYKRPLVNSGAYRGAQSGFFAGLTFDHDDARNIYLCRQLLKPSGTPFNLMDTSVANYKTIKASDWTTVDAVHELERWTTNDGGITWDSLAITRGSANKNMLPCVPRNHKPNMKVDCMWLNGVYTSMSPDGYNCAVRIFPYKDGESLPTTAVQPAARSTIAPHGMVCNGAGVTFYLTDPAKASCKVYSLNGKLMANLTPLVRAMNRGYATIPFAAMRAVSGAYIIDLDNGQTRTEGSVFVPK